MIPMAGTVRIRVREILDDRGLSVEQFADQAKIHYRTALSIVKDRSERIDKNTLAKICDALHITPGEVFEYTPEKN